MAQTTYKKLAEMIRDSYYKIIPSDDAPMSLRLIAEMVASEVAEMAWGNAIENSNLGESTYANDQFISVFHNIAISEDSNGVKSSILPSTPAALPNNQEVSEVSITGASKRCLPCIPMTSRSSFSQGLIGYPKSMVFYKIEGGKIIFDSVNPLVEGTVTIKLVGAVSGTDLLSSSLNIPKNMESRIMTKILSRLLPLKNQPIDYVNDSISNPS